MFFSTAFSRTCSGPSPVEENRCEASRELASVIITI